jgi:hypothetical protein
VPSISKLELILHKRTPTFDFASGGQVHVIDSSFPVVNGLGDTRLQEIVVWHGIGTMGQNRMFKFSPCSPAFKAVLTRDGDGDVWRVQQAGPGGFADRAELENRGWKIIYRIMDL